MMMAEGKETDPPNEPSLAMKVVLSTVRNKFRNVRQMSTSTLAQWLGNSRGDNSAEVSENTPDGCLVLLDTRPEEEYIVSHLPDSIRVDPSLNDIGSMIQEIPLLNKRQTDGSGSGPVTVVCYCSLGYRSCVMAQKIQDHLKTRQGAEQEETRVKVYNLEGSLFKWANEGRPMVDRDNKPTIYVHPYGAIYGRLLHKHLRREIPS